MSKATLLQGDCLELMNRIPDSSIDMVLSDLPYGTTRCRWDTPINLQELWEQYRRVVKENGAIALFSAQPFTTELIGSNKAMGRKERRAKERQERKESIRMTPDRIYELKQKTANEAVRRVQEIEKGKEKQRAETALDMLLLFGMTYLHEQKGWGKQRLENYYDGCMDLLKEFEDGKHTIKSLRDKLVEETKINLAEVKE